MIDPDRLAVLAHEVRSPVAALVAIADAVADENMPAEWRHRLLLLAIAAGRDVERMLADPELFSLRLEDVDVAGLLHAVARPQVSVVAQQLSVRGDPTRLRQALANLVENALRHGGAVSIEARAEGGEVVLDVSDDGPGVDPSLDPFAPGVSGAGSSGLGLYVARAIAEAHGGSLTLVSHSGPGVTFRLSLPGASAAPG